MFSLTLLTTHWIAELKNLATEGLVFEISGK